MEHTFQRHLKGFPFIARDAKQQGIRIVNLSKDSRITQFEKKNLSDIL
jgi:hypothetical protein